MHKPAILAKNTVIYSLTSIIPKIVGIALMPVYTRFLTPKDYGILGMLGLITEPIAIFAILQISSAFLRYYFEYDVEERVTYISTIFWGITGYALAFYSILLLFGKPLFQWIIKSEDITFVPYIVVTLVGAFLTTFTVIPSGLFKCRQEAAKWTGLVLASFVLGTGFRLYFIVFKLEGAWGSVKGRFIVRCIITLVFLWILFRNVSFKFSWEKMKKSLLFSIPLIPSNLAIYIFTFSDRWFLERFISLSEVGLYSFGSNFAFFMGTMNKSFGDTYQPYFFDFAKKAESDRATIPKIATMWIALLGTIVLVFSLFAKDIIYILAHENFHIAYRIVPILVLCYYFRGLQVFPGTCLMFLMKTKLISTISILSGVVNIALNFLFIPKYGMMGAASATLCSAAFAFTLSFLLGQKYFRIDYEYGKIFKFLVFGGLVYFIGTMFSQDNLVIDIILKSFLMSIFVFAIVYMRIVDKKQIYRAVEWGRSKLFKK